jgi:hypothetical protein
MNAFEASPKGLPKNITSDNEFSRNSFLESNNPFSSQLLANSNWVYANPFAVFATTLKGYRAIDQGKQGVIVTPTHIITRMHLGTPLTNDNIASAHRFTAIFFYAKTLSIRVATVPCTACTFLMSHDKFPKVLLKTVYSIMT